MSATIQSQILDRVRRRGRGKVFTPKDFLDLGSRDAADKGLSRLVKSGDLQRLTRGLYHFPRMNTVLGIPVVPDADEIAHALARQTGSRVAPSGAVAANRLGLSTQVPAKPVYLTDGRSRQVKVGNMVFVVKHVPPKELPSGSPTSAMVFQALRHVGQDAIDTQMIARLRGALSDAQRHGLVRDARYTTDWIAEVVQRVAEESTEMAVHG
jgi:hypothetical protein